MTSPKQKQSDPPQESAVPHRRYVDNSGHMDPAHARRLRNLTAGNRRSEDEDHAFVDHPRTMVEMAENFGEQSVVNMTTGEQETIASGPQGASTAGATSTTEGDLDSTLWERELSADEEEDVLEDMVSPDESPTSERDED